MERLRVGVIGTGNMGRNHIRNLVEEKIFILVGIYDKNPEQAKEVAEKYDIDVFDDVDVLLDEIDAAIVAVPSSLHKEAALKVAQHGVHALVEKPLATNSKDAKVIVDAFAKAGLKLAVGHIERFNPVFKELKKLVDPKEIFYIEACRYSPFSGSGRITDTSVVEDLMIHDIDLVCALMGGVVTSVHGRGESVKSDQIDFATCLLDFSGKAHAIVNASRVFQNKERMITVHTSNACYCADLLAKTLNIYRSTNLIVDISHENSYKQDGIVQKVYVPIEEPLRAELVAFYDAVANDGVVAVDGIMASKAIDICEEVVNRAKKGGVGL